MSKINIPAGWKLVPAEPTEAMLIAARDWSICKLGRAVGNDGSSGCYAAMLAAAPTPPVDAVLGEPVAIRAALAELVACKELKDRLQKLHEMGHGTDYGDYHRRQPLAWEAARKALATPVASRAVQAEPVAREGLPLAQEPKYTVNGSAIVNRTSGEAIPADEPVFILRARDLKALPAIAFYSSSVSDGQYEHWNAIFDRLADFSRFKAQYPERMKEPDTAPPAPAATAEPLSYCLNCDSPMPKGCGGCFDGQDKCARTDSSAPTSTEPPMSPDGEGPLYATPDSAGAVSLAPREDTRLLDWIEQKVCDVSRLGDVARTLRISWNNGADSVFVGPHYNATWREAIRTAIAASPAGAEGAGS